MKKTIKIDEKNTLTLSNNVGWLLAYRDQFGVDIVPALVPVLNAVIEIYAEIAKQTGDLKTAADIFTKIDTATIQGAILELAGVQITDLVNVVWAMAKAADDDIDEPRTWVRQFETFPLDVIAPAVLELAVRGLISGKNSTRLLDALKVVEPKTNA